MEEIFSAYDKWNGLIPLFGGIYVSLIAFKVINPNKKNPEKMEIWHKRFGPMMKVIGPLVVLFGIITLTGMLNP